MVTTLLAIVVILSDRMNEWRDEAVQLALLQNREASFWWPPAWRQELKASAMVEGDVTFGGKPVKAGTVWFILEPQNRRFPAKITNGRYSMQPGRLPVASYRIEVRSEEGAQSKVSKSKWAMPISQGLHRINLAF